MKAFRIFAALWLLAVSTLPAHADIVHQDSPGLTLYARIRTSSTTSVTAVLTEGTSNGVGYYVAADSLIDDVLTTAGTYPFKVFSGSPSASADHPLRGVGTLTWTGANETTPADNRVVKLIGTGDNAETIIEAASAGTLCRLSAGAHTINAEIAIPSGVEVVGAGRTATTITGDPGTGTSAIFRVNGNNRFANFSVTNANDGAFVATTAAGAACDLTIENVYTKGDDDCVLLYVTSSGRHRLTVTDSVIDCTSWDGIGVVAASADVFLNGTRFLGGFRPIQVLLAGNTVNLTLDNCVFDMTSAGSGLECLSLQTTNNADRILCRCRNVDFYAPAGKIALLANTGGSTGVVTVEDMGGCNFDDTKITLTPGSGTATFTRNYPTATWAQTARTITGTGTDAITATSIAANAITDAEVASDVTIASVTGNVGGNVTGSVASVGTGGITAASFAADAITAAKVASDAITEIWAASAATPSAGSFGEAVVQGGEGGSTPPDARDLEPVNATWTLRRIGNGTFRSTAPIHLTPGTSGYRAGWDCNLPLLLPQGTVIAEQAPPELTAASADLTLTHIGHGEKVAKVEIEIEGDAVATDNPNTEEVEGHWIKTTITNSNGAGPIVIYGQVVIDEAPE